MPLIVDVNSYLDVPEADAIFANMLGASSWAAETEKELVLIAATQQVDLLGGWLYNKTLSTQALEHPRNYEIAVQPQILEAVCRVALQISLRGGIDASTEQDLVVLKAGPVQLNFSPTSMGAATSGIFTDTVLKLLAPFRHNTDAVWRS